MGVTSGDVGGASGGVSVLGIPISFEPKELDFGDQPLGLPVLRKVRVHNLNAQSSIQMLSISGNTIHFHCSFFADKVTLRVTVLRHKVEEKGSNKSIRMFDNALSDCVYRFLNYLAENPQICFRAQQVNVSFAYLMENFV